MLSPAKNLSNPRIIAISDDPEVTATLARLVDGSFQAIAEVMPQSTSAPDVIEWQPDLILYSVDEGVDPAGRIAELASVPRSRLLAVGNTNDVELYRHVIKAGAADYLLAPLDEGHLADAIDRALTPVETTAIPEEVDQPGIHVMIGARGGVGTTTLSVSTAWMVGERLGKETALIDLDLYFGSCALALDLLPGSGLRDALANPDRIDSLFIGSAMINASDHLFVLGAEEALDQNLTIARGAVDSLIDAVSQTFQTIIIDLPRTMLDHAATILQEADTITVVTDLSVAGLRDAVRLQDHLGAMGAQTVQIAVHQSPKPVRQVSPKEMEQGLGRDVTFWIPHDEKSVTAAATQGKAATEIAGNRGGLSKAILPIAKDIAGVETEPKRKFAWRW